jgi:hypothetical protein
MFMNYLIDADVCIANGDDVHRSYYDWLVEWSTKNDYYIISQKNFDDLYSTIGKTLLYNSKAIYANGGRTVYIQSRLVEHDDVLSKDPTRIPVMLEEPLTYYGNDMEFGRAVIGSGQTYCSVRNWKEAWKNLREEELCA